MKAFLSVFVLVPMLFSVSAAAQTHVSSGEVVVDGVVTKIRTYESEGLTERPVLLVALHGDSPRRNPSYQYGFARTVAAQVKNTISVGLLRPGYSDDADRRSDGVRGETVGDNYDKPRIDQIAAAIQQLGTHHNAQQIVLAGHSGGSAITAKLIAAYPALINHAVIVSCPCDIPAWRADMYEFSKYEGFRRELDVVSPIDVASSISDETSISMFVGDNDRVTQEYLNRAYFNELIKLNKNAELTILPGEHNIFMHEQIISSIVAKISQMNAGSH